MGPRPMACTSSFGSAQDALSLSKGATVGRSAVVAAIIGLERQELFFDRGLVDKHYWDVIFDRVDTMTRVAFQSGSVVHENDRCLAVRQARISRSSASSGMDNTPPVDAPNYSRKVTIDTLMRNAIFAAAAVLSMVSTALAQTKPSPPDRPGAAYYEFMMGLQLEGQGDSAGASAAYERAERLDPQSAEIPAALAELYVRMNRPVDAIAAGERAVKASPTNPEANWILGSLYARMSEMPTVPRPIAAPTRSAPSRIWKRPAATRIQPCR